MMTYTKHLIFRFLRYFWPRAWLLGDEIHVQLKKNRSKRLTKLRRPRHRLCTSLQFCNSLSLSLSLSLSSFESLSLSFWIYWQRCVVWSLNREIWEFRFLWGYLVRGPVVLSISSITFWWFCCCWYCWILCLFFSLEILEILLLEVWKISRFQSIFVWILTVHI